MRRWFSRLFILTVITLLLVSPRQGMAAPEAPQSAVTLNPIADGYMWSATGGSNGANEFFKLGVDDASGAYRAVLKFALSDIPAGATINSATLRIYYYSYSGSTAARSIEARRITDDWSEIGFGWHNNYGSTVYDTISVGGGNAQWFDWDITTLVQTWQDGAHENYGIMLIGSDETGSSDNWFAFYSREEDDLTSLHPQLVVSYTPAGPPDIRVDPVLVQYSYDRSTQASITDDEVAMANPAAKYCRKLGYDYTTFTAEDGAQNGVCTLAEKTVCDGWDFLNGTCGQDYNICALAGYETEVHHDGNHPLGATWAQCLDPVTGMRTTATDMIYVGATRSTYLEEPQFETEPLPNAKDSVAALPGSHDWRDVNGGDWLSPVKDQGICGSCWSFSATGVAEAAANIANDDPDQDWDLSEQYLVTDCCIGCGDCAGGSKSSGLDFYKYIGVPDEACLPYGDGGAGGCAFLSGSGDCDPSLCAYCSSTECSDFQCSDACADADARRQFIADYGWVGYTATSDDIKQAMLDHGPLAASLSMTGSFDGNGVYSCSSNDGTNHAVILAGWDDSDGGYWIVKNSWGTGWGTNGYFKVGYDTCAIAKYVYWADAAPTSYDVMIYSEGGDILNISAIDSQTNPCWHTLDMPYGGLPASLSPGDDSGFNVDVDGSCVAVDGVYTDTVTVTSDDPDEGTVDVILELTVTGGQPDLIISGTSLDSAPLIAGETYTWTGTVENQDIGIAGTSDLALYLGTSCASLDGQLDSTSVASLAPGAGSSESLSFTLANDASGTRYFIAQADANHDLSESNETNNSDCIQRTVLACYTMDTDASPAGGGSVIVTPDPTCDAGSPGWVEGTVVTLTAAANTGYTFNSWSGDATSSTNPLPVTLTADKSITAEFDPICHTLTLNVDPVAGGSIIVAPDPICAAGQYLEGSIITLTAQSATGYAFGGWSGALNGSTNPQTLSIDTNTAVTATFSAQAICHDLSLTVDPAGSGSINPNPAPDCNVDQYTAGTVVTLTAQAATGFVFDQWNGDLSGSTNPQAITMDDDVTIGADFAGACYDLTLGVDPTEGGSQDVTPSPNCNGDQYAHGTVITLTAQANTHYTFANWRGDLDGGANPQSLSMDGHKDITANFTAVPCSTLTLDVDPTGGGTLTADPAPNCGSQYYAGTTITVTANATADFAFDSWAEDLSGTENPKQFVINESDMQVQARFSGLCYDLDVTLTPNDGGTVLVQPLPNCGDQYSAGTVVTMTVSAETPYAFAYWTGDLTGTSNPETLTMDADKAVYVKFDPICYSLTAVPNLPEAGSIAVSMAPNCGASWYEAGTVVTLTAETKQGYAFTHWSDALTGTSNPQSLTMTGDQDVVANFDLMPVCYDISWADDPAYGGDITALPVPNCNVDQYIQGTRVLLQANPATGWVFMGWEGDFSDPGQQIELIVMGNAALTATYAYMQGDYILLMPMVMR